MWSPLTCDQQVGDHSIYYINVIQNNNSKYHIDLFVIEHVNCQSIL